MPPALLDPLSVTPASSDAVLPRSAPETRRFGDLRGLQWRMNLGVLPSSTKTSIDDLRRVTANCRRRYASLRRRLLVEPLVPKDGTNSPNHVIDNPLSQNPDSTWSRFFRNAELERMVDQDLSRLYPEHGSYFQTPGCQSMLRRILLLWCLRHPECGYRQGMHELLAPLLYVLQVDLERLSEIRKLYEDHFTDRFDDLLCQENDLSYSFDFRKSPELEDESGSHGNVAKANSLEELPEIQNIVLLSDAYGAEGELGVVLSEKFMEHDAYCMFDALMNGDHGAVTMADFFSSSPVSGSHSGQPPVIEASTALYYLLSLVDSSLHSHLFDLGVEPQYFSLRWLRVLFGREFSLANLLIIWDEIFASENSTMEKGADDCEVRILNSPRGAFIAAMAVAMILHLRSSLLATENPTRCLQRLLNFPEDINIEKLLEKAKSLQDLALSIDISSSSLLYIGSHHQSKSIFARSVTLPSESLSPKTPLNLLPDSYWEEKWRVAHKAEELKQDGLEKQKQVPTRKKGWTEKVKNSLRRAGSGPPLSRIQTGKTFRRSLLEDLRKALGSDEDAGQMQQDETLCQHDNISEAVEVQEDSGCNGDNNYLSDDRSPSGNSGSEEDLFIFSDPTTPPNEVIDHEIASQTSSSVASNLSLDECNETSGTSSHFPIPDHPEKISQTSQCNTENSACIETSDTSPNDLPLPISDHPENISQTSECNAGNSECIETSDTSPNDLPLPLSDPPENKSSASRCNGDKAQITAMPPKEKKQNKLQWLWPFGRNNADAITERIADAAEAANHSRTQNNTPQPASSALNEHGSSVSCRGESVDQNVMGTLKNIGQSMLDHIQVIESVFQQDRKGQVTAMTALKELRKISNLLSEM